MVKLQRRVPTQRSETDHALTITEAVGQAASTHLATSVPGTSRTLDDVRFRAAVEGLADIKMRPAPRQLSAANFDFAVTTPGFCHRMSGDHNERRYRARLRRASCLA